MAKTRITKRALVACVLALALSVSAFVGVTFAWFTDSVSSGVNKIISGNLDIGLNYWDADSGKYEDATNVELFDKNALWEPGHVEVAYLEIENRGSLSFSYLFTVYALRETEGYLKSGEAFYLSDYLTYAIASYDVEKDGVPKPGTFSVTLVVKMGFPCRSAGKESACNEGDLGSIPGLGRSPVGEKGYPLQYSGQENSMDCIVNGVAKSP